MTYFVVRQAKYRPMGRIYCHVHGGTSSNNDKVVLPGQRRACAVSHVRLAWLTQESVCVGIVESFHCARRAGRTAMESAPRADCRLSPLAAVNSVAWRVPPSGGHAFRTAVSASAAGHPRWTDRSPTGALSG